MNRAVLALALLLVPAAALAQGPTAPASIEPMPWLVLDARAGFPSLGNDAITASGLGLTQADLPGRALTGLVGLHAYPMRRGRWKLGVGGELLLGRGRLQKKDPDGEPFGSPVTRRLKSVSAQVSLNFGRGQGWSYLTAGSGPFTFDTFLGDGPGDGSSRSTLNVGGGARWFKWRHAGFTIDMRFYLTKAADAAGTSAPRAAKRLVVLSAGLSFK